MTNCKMCSTHINDCDILDDFECASCLRGRLAEAEKLLRDVRYELHCVTVDRDQRRADQVKMLARLAEVEADAVTARNERDEYKRLYDLRGKVLRRPCLQCGYTPSVISLAGAAARSAVEAKGGQDADLSDSRTGVRQVRKAPDIRR